MNCYSEIAISASPCIYSNVNFSNPPCFGNYSNGNNLIDDAMAVEQPSSNQKEYMMQKSKDKDFEKRRRQRFKLFTTFIGIFFDDEPYTCKYCSKAFGYRRSLMNHELAHTLLAS